MEDLRLVSCVDTVWHVGDDKEIILDAGGVYHFGHICTPTAGNRGTLRLAPRLQHEVTVTDDGVTVRPSILCVDCGTHGFVTDSTWAAC